MKINSNRLKWMIVLFVALASNFAKAQTCTANFVYSVGANGNTTFTATAIPSATVYYYWNFGGSGATFTNINTAACTYTANGYYFVNLMVQNSPQTCFTSTNIIIYVNTTVNTPTCPSVNASFVSTPGSNGSVSFSSTSTGSLAGAIYVWSMGDGTTIYSGSVIPLSHTYTANSTYIATLTILVGSSPACAYTSTAPIVVNTSSLTICNLNSNFTSSLLAGGVVQFSNSSTGTSSNVIYSWNYGDGSPTSNSISPLHAYTSNGTYTVTLTANNNYTPVCMSTKTAVVNVSSVCNLNPAFTHTTNSNGEISFTNTSTGTITNTSYQWTFGDGNSSSVAATSHTYANSGTYTVTLLANATTNSVFPCIASISQSIVITNTCIVNTNFSVIPSGTPQFWYAVVGNTANIAIAEWSWGDGSPNSIGIVNSHTYASAGTYSVCLNVTLTCGATGSYCTSQYMNKSQADGADIVYLNCLTQELLETGLNNNSKEDILVHVSPNPNGGDFEISLRGLNFSSAKVQVYNLIGKVVFETECNVHNGILTKNIKLENVASGIHFMKVTIGGDVYTQKVIVTK